MEIYSDFLKVIIPKTRVLFNLVKKYIKGKLSMMEAIKYLEPFLIYSDDLTFNQYIEIEKFINITILAYNKTFIENSRAFSVLKTINKGKEKTYLDPILNVLDQTQPNSSNVLRWYNLESNNKSLVNMSSSESLKKIKLADCGNLFNTSLAFENLSLMFPDKLSKVFDLDKDKLKEQLENDVKNDMCNNYIIAKKYYSKSLLEGDNDKTIYFDRHFDDTNYEIIENEYKKEKDTLSPEELELYITEQLIRKKKYDNSTAEYVAESLVNGVKKIRDGQYAILTEEEYDIPNYPVDTLEYFIRKNGIWVEAKDIDPTSFIKEEDILCNIQEKCLMNSNANNCESLDVSKSNILNNTINEILEQFDKNYEISKTELQTALDKKIGYYGGIFEELTNVKQYKLHQNNMIKYEIGMKLGDVNQQIVSPKQHIIDMIRGQSNFVKKQTDILKFVQLFARPGNPIIANIHDGEMETPWFYYCKKTDTKLLPTFSFLLAKTFVENPNNYNNKLKQLIKEIGVCNESGEWIDKNSGEAICLLDFDIEEGYEDGFKVSSRSVLKTDTSEDILTLLNKKPTKLLSPQGQVVSNIIETLSNNGKINISQQREFIIKVVTELMNDVNVIEKEPAYRLREEKINDANKDKKKPIKLPSYMLVYNSTLMYLTLGMFLIGIQTSIPSIKSNKTFPGCVRSFTGFPLEGAGDDTGLLYVACIAQGSKSKTSPWNVLGSKMKDTDIRDKIKTFLIKYLLKYPEVELKIREKVAHLLEEPELDIPKEHQLTNWTTFLPPLHRIKIKRLQNVSQTFEEGLVKKIKLSDSSQYDDLLVIQSKIISFSMGIQESIQDIVDKKDLLMHSTIKPFMDNACCNEKEGVNLNTLQYFIGIDPDIQTNNVIVHQLTAILRDIKLLTESAIFLSNVDTKIQRPDINLTTSYTLSENTIYLAFITMCKFNSLTPLTADILTVCNSKPDYLSKNETLHEQISKLKRDGKNYTVASFLRLFQIISKKNTIQMNMNTIKPSYINSLRQLLTRFDDSDNTIIAKSLTDRLNSLLDISDVSINSINISTNEIPHQLMDEDKPEMRVMKNYLITSISKMRHDLIDFITRKAKMGNNSLKRITKFINELSVWQFDINQRNQNILISDNALYNYTNYFKTFIKMLSTTFPSMILNKRSQSMISPEYWGLSKDDAAKIESFVTDYNEHIIPYYENTDIINILPTIRNECKYIVALSNETPILSSIKVGDKETYSAFDKKTTTLLYEYYLLQVFTQYVSLTKDPNIVSKIVNDNGSNYDFLIQEQIHFSEGEQEFIIDDINRLQTTVCDLLVTFINIMMDSKNIIDISYDKIMDRVFRLKEREKDSFTDRLRPENMTEEALEVEKILKNHKIGVWHTGNSHKKYNNDDNNAEKKLMLKIVELEQQTREQNNATDKNIDAFIDEAIADENIQEEIDNERFNMNQNEDYMDGNPYGDEDEDE